MRTGEQIEAELEKARRDVEYFWGELADAQELVSELEDELESLEDEENE